MAPKRQELVKGSQFHMVSISCFFLLQRPRDEGFRDKSSYSEKPPQDLGGCFQTALGMNFLNVAL